MLTNKLSNVCNQILAIKPSSIKFQKPPMGGCCSQPFVFVKNTKVLENTVFNLCGILAHKNNYPSKWVVTSKNGVQSFNYVEFIYSLLGFSSMYKNTPNSYTENAIQDFFIPS